MLPRITVVTPSVNQRKFVETTMLSVLEQQYPSLEYMVLDGGSRDGSAELIEQYSERLAFWCSEPDGGQSAAIARGFSMASGDILCWLNSDDVFLPGALAAVGAWFERHPEEEALSCGAYMIDAQGNRLYLGRCSYTLGVGASYSRLRLHGQE